jgi:hypothetical protein
MIDQTAQLPELPDYWQERIQRLRSENHELRSRLKGNGISPQAELDELPKHWEKTIARLRQENGKNRVERNALRIEVAQLRAELEASK